MKLYEIYSPELETNIRFKILSPQETEAIVAMNAHAEHEVFMRVVLEAVIYNLKTDVTTAIKKISKETAKECLNILFTGCIMLNPGLDVDSWVQIANAPSLLAKELPARAPRTRRPKRTAPAKSRESSKRIPRSKMLNLERYLYERVVGQEEAIKELSSAIKRSHVGLNDENRPRGVFLFAGASGVGKTLLAKELHDFLYGSGSMVRIDCGEYQHKHESSKLIGAPPGYLGHESGGFLTNEVMENPNTVILLDEVEKAHPDIWNTFLRVFDEGWLTDAQGNKIPFHNAIIIMTTNLGNRTTVDDMLNQGMGFNRFDHNLPSREKIVRVTTEAINKYFSPEFRNRIDKTIVFNHLNSEDLNRIAELELKLIQGKLEKRGYVFTFDNSAIEAMIREGVDHVQGARGLSQLRRDRIENILADRLIERSYPRGTAFKLSYDASSFQVTSEPLVSAKRTLARRAPTQKESVPSSA